MKSTHIYIVISYVGTCNKHKIEVALEVTQNKGIEEMR